MVILREIKGALVAKTPLDVWLQTENNPWKRMTIGRKVRIESLRVSSAGILTEYLTTIAFLQMKMTMSPRV